MRLHHSSTARQGQDSMGRTFPYFEQSVSLWLVHSLEGRYTPYEGPTLANQKSRKLRVFGRKLEGSHSQCYHYVDKHYI